MRNKKMKKIRRVRNASGPFSKYRKGWRERGLFFARSYHPYCIPF
jgi:hypothetical protein